jgi:hypothetical protein
VTAAVIAALEGAATVALAEMTVSSMWGVENVIAAPMRLPTIAAFSARTGESTPTPTGAPGIKVRRLHRREDGGTVDAELTSSSIMATAESGPATRERPGPWHQERSPDARET